MSKYTLTKKQQTLYNKLPNQFTLCIDYANTDYPKMRINDYLDNLIFKLSADETHTLDSLLQIEYVTRLYELPNIDENAKKFAYLKKLDDCSKMIQPKQRCIHLACFPNNSKIYFATLHSSMNFITIHEIVSVEKYTKNFVFTLKNTKTIDICDYIANEYSLTEIKRYNYCQLSKRQKTYFNKLVKLIDDPLMTLDLHYFEKRQY